MTCILGYLDKKNNRVVIGGDSAGVSGLDITVRRDPKVFKVGDFVFGCTSSFRMIQLLRFSFKPPALEKGVYEYMCTDFIEAVRECFNDGGYLQKFSLGNEKGGVFLVGYKDRLFCVDSDFQVGESFSGVNAIGCGSSYALGAIHSLSESELMPIEKVIKSLEASEFFCGGVVKPFVIIETK